MNQQIKCVDLCVSMCVWSAKMKVTLEPNANALQHCEWTWGFTEISHQTIFMLFIICSGVLMLSRNINSETYWFEKILLLFNWTIGHLRNRARTFSFHCELSLLLGLHPSHFSLKTQAFRNIYLLYCNKKTSKSNYIYRKHQIK